jgi:hypothetical protein
VKWCPYVKAIPRLTSVLVRSGTAGMPIRRRLLGLGEESEMVRYRSWNRAIADGGASAGVMIDAHLSITLSFVSVTGTDRI